MEWWGRLALRERRDLSGTTELTAGPELTGATELTASVDLPAPPAGAAVAARTLIGVAGE
jgi:hypothetical protein